MNYIKGILPRQDYRMLKEEYTTKLETVEKEISTLNEKLEKDINRLEIASRNSAKWSNEAEKGKSKKYNSETTIDKGYVGHKADKVMKS